MGGGAGREETGRDGDDEVGAGATFDGDAFTAASTARGPGRAGDDVEAPLIAGAAPLGALGLGAAAG